MIGLTADEIASIRGTQQDAMPDLGYVLVCGTTGVASSPDGITQTYTSGTGAAIACGYNPGVPGETADGSNATYTFATIRIPIGTTVSAADRFKLTSRLSSTAGMPITFAIIGDPQLGPTCKVLNVRQVVGTADI